MQGDPFNLLLRQRTIFMGGEVEDFSADAIISQLLLLDSQDPSKDIKLFINSPGQDWLAVAWCLHQLTVITNVRAQLYHYRQPALLGRAVCHELASRHQYTSLQLPFDLQVAQSQQAWAFMMPCCCARQMCRHTALGWQHQWVHSCWELESVGSATACPMPAS
jgi:hypothetical protein